MNEIFIEKDKPYLRIAIKDHEKLLACYIEEETEEAVPGQIYLGIVKNIVPAIKGAFIDIGKAKDAFMHLDNNRDLKKGDYFLVEVLREATELKSANVTSLITIPGTYVVVNPMEKALKISRKISNSKFINEVKEQLKDVSTYGITVRSSAENVDINIIREEVQALNIVVDKIIAKGKYSLKPQLIYDDGGALGRILRDYINDGTKRIIVDDIKNYDLVKENIEKLHSSAELIMHEESRGIFDCYSIEKEILALRHKKVVLKSGGYIIIEKTEALYSIDVNSGKSTGEVAISKTAFKTNLEAAEEIARQIILRNLSGIIVIDFINMKDKKEKTEVIKILEAAFKKDNNKTTIYPFTDVNLVQITRKKRGKDIGSFLEESCKHCGGEGARLKWDYLKLLIKNQLIKLKGQHITKEFVITIDSKYKSEVQKKLTEFITFIEGHDCLLYLLYLDNFNSYKVEPVIFDSQRKNLQEYKIY
ncbi:ribonuclease E/G [Clostridium cellulovorans]|uniref:Ribonuclease, Rne/Rng family n=1 Tax=Clostridium cellulovorans (strain ATCC 35296 / DSM 3052 / OCM 3 / 743B) TaxID=573061 RepID=D9SS03_CLOC7|nr:ribonuclease E/G [Clostridium cellulovorans]ADL52450.1 ribonuclease, Rne/Rng family [Clostridium cellulovorans 743B]